MKLFLSTLQFLLYYAPRNKEVHVIYPGCSPGNNLNDIIELFPQCRWYLIDPSKFNKDLVKNPKVLYKNNSLFTKEIVEEIKEKVKGKYVLMISDIRLSPDPEAVDRDNNLQREWVKQLKPNYAQLKFRMPRVVKKYKYFEGKIFLQMFPRCYSTETRLIVNGKKIKEKFYSEDYYEGVMYYYNRVLRPSYYRNNMISKFKFLDHCHDCVSMLNLLDEYRKKYKNNKYSKIKLDKYLYQLLTKIMSSKDREKYKRTVLQKLNQSYYNNKKYLKNVI